MTRETSKTLRNLDAWKEPKTPNASSALFWLLSAYVDRPMRTALTNLFNEIGEHDGMQALQLLQGMCAPQDETERHNASTLFQSISIEEGETIQHFNTRFNRLASLVRASGKKLSSPKKLRQYFRALQLHPSSHILLEVQKWARKYEEGESISLAYVQLVVQRHEEKLFPELSGNAHRRTEPQMRRSRAEERSSQPGRRSSRNP